MVQLFSYVHSTYLSPLLSVSLVFIACIVTRELFDNKHDREAVQHVQDAFEADVSAKAHNGMVIIWTGSTSLQCFQWLGSVDNSIVYLSCQQFNQAQTKSFLIIRLFLSQIVAMNQSTLLVLLITIHFLFTTADDTVYSAKTVEEYHKCVKASLLKCMKSEYSRSTYLQLQNVNKQTEHVFCF